MALPFYVFFFLENWNQARLFPAPATGVTQPGSHSHRQIAQVPHRGIKFSAEECSHAKCITASRWCGSLSAQIDFELVQKVSSQLPRPPTLWAILISNFIPARAAHSNDTKPLNPDGSEKVPERIRSVREKHLEVRPPRAKIAVTVQSKCLVLLSACYYFTLSSRRMAYTRGIYLCAAVITAFMYEDMGISINKYTHCAACFHTRFHDVRAALSKASETGWDKSQIYAALNAINEHSCMKAYKHMWIEIEKQIVWWYRNARFMFKIKFIIFDC